MKRIRNFAGQTMVTRSGVRAASPRQCWRAVSLTWRKAARPASLHGWQAASAVVRKSWAHHFALHFNVAMSFSPRLKAVRSIVRPQTTVFWHRLDAKLSKRPVLHKSSRFTSSTIVDRSVSQTFFGTSKICDLKIAKLVRTFRSGDIRNLHCRVAPGVSKRLSFEPASVSGPVPNQAAKVPSAATPALRRTYANRNDLILRKLAAAGSVASFAERAPFRASELVWRSENEPHAPTRVEPSQVAIGVPPPSVASLGTRLSDQSCAPPSFDQSRLIDAALIERVTDGVIGRVERRMRIERERRGL